jgi:5-(carboxyamino)imidazole ribonucleotide synthase
VISIEIEHVNVDALFELEKQGKKVIPMPKSSKPFNKKFFKKSFIKTQYSKS